MKQLTRYEKNREDCLESSKKYYQANKEYKKIYSKQYQKDNKDKINARRRVACRRGKNLELIKKRSAQYRKKNREVLALKAKIWRKNNREATKAYARIRYQKTKLLPSISLSTRIRRGINNSLKNGKCGKHWENLVGYTLEALIERLIDTLPAEYTWTDYIGGADLHIDHIVPISAFNFQDIEDVDFKKCWALDNLQLLPAKENLSKGSKLDESYHFMVM